MFINLSLFFNDRWFSIIVWKLALYKLMSISCEKYIQISKIKQLNPTCSLTTNDGVTVLNKFPTAASM